MNVFRKDYLPPKPNVYARGKDSQDAHEAIRPTNLQFAPDMLAAVLSRDPAPAVYIDLEPIPCKPDGAPDFPGNECSAPKRHLHTSRDRDADIV